MKKLVYIAGKLSDDAVNYIKNMNRMIHWAGAIRGLGFAVYVPCLDLLEGLVAGNMDYLDYFENSQVILRRCDAVYVVPENWEDSTGTKKEIALAKEVGIPVFFDPLELRERIL